MRTIPYPIRSKIMPKLRTISIAAKKRRIPVNCVLVIIYTLVEAGGTIHTEGGA
jgi:hypothetical protein